jgi:hypothetical protein
MGALVDVEDLGGTAEVAALLECPKQQIRSLQRNPRFPQPVAHLASTPLWDLAEVRAFKATWKRRKTTTQDHTDAS